MAGKRRKVLDIREMLRCMRQGHSNRRIAAAIGGSRNTVRGYRAWFEKEGLLTPEGTLPTAAELQARLSVPKEVQTQPTLMPYRQEITEAIAAKLQMSVAWRRFGERHPDVRVGYATFRRFVRRHVEPATPAPVMRIETAAGEQAQVDFGYAGLMPRVAGEAPRKTWVFVMTLAFSRHQYVELVQDQSVPTWLRLHRNAFESFGGVPATVVLDNLKAGIVRACANDPMAQRSYRECAEHYNFTISPCLPRMPRHKGKVERGIQYVKSSLLADHHFADVVAGNAAARQWVNEVAGKRVHGTLRVQPLERFLAQEQPALRPLPAAPFDDVSYRTQTLPADCHVSMDQAFYSVPHHFVGKEVVVAATCSTVRVYHEHALVATHVRASSPGTRRMNLAHFPPEKVRYMTQDRPWCRAKAIEAGPHTAAFIEPMISGRVDRLRGAQATLRLGEKYGAERLETACARALSFGADDVRTVANILARNLDRPSPALVTLHASRPTFARSFHNLFNSATSVDVQGEA